MIAGKTAVVILTMGVSLSIAAGTFWAQDLQYARPTPVPASYRPVPQFAVPQLPDAIRPRSAQDFSRPTLLNFFNPDCPCSRFNLDHVRSLIQRYGAQVRCIAIMETSRSAEAQGDFAALHIDSEWAADPQRRIAAACGVYSTPQAVLLDPSGRLLYRGNYNAGRYCADPQSEYVRLALDAALSHAALPRFSPGATRAYGCALPIGNTKEIFQRP